MLPCRFGVFACLFLAVPAFGAGESIEFNRDIRPILSDKCFHCHGADAAAKNIPLRLDLEELAKAEIHAHRAIVEGHPESSELIRRVTSENKAQRMPPSYSGLTLSDAEIEKLRLWIAGGAKWQTHWSFIAPVRPEAPSGTNNSAWIRNPIDAFVLDRLQKAGLKPSPEASRETWLRRVTFDLTGLPPTLSELDSFLQDRSTDAYERVVDRLLASRRYGERMAIRWLDASRYADTNGYQYDAERQMWRWRDWVIEAFNRNQPFDQFVREQIAGDLLPHATLQQKIATGFNRNHRANTEDGIVPEEYAVEYVVDRVETASTVFLGLTMGCARCHNHKYDPFTQKEFYQLFAYFNNVPENGRAMKFGNSPPLVEAPTDAQQSQLQQLNGKLQVTRSVLEQLENAQAAHRANWEGALLRGLPVYWEPTEQLSAQWDAGRTAQASAFDGTRFADLGDVAPFDISSRVTLSAWVYSNDTLNGSIVSRMVDNSRGRGYGIHLHDGHVHVNLTNVWVDDALRVDSEETLTPGQWHHLLVTYAGVPMAESLRLYVDGKLAKVTVGLDRLYRPFRNAGAVVKDPVRVGAGEGAEKRFRGRIADVRLYSRVVEPEEVEVLALGESLNEIARKPIPERSPAEQRLLRWGYLPTAAPPDLQEAWRKYRDVLGERSKLELQFPTVMVMAERPERRDTFVLLRGAYDKPGEKVEPGLPHVLPGTGDNWSKDRLGLAQWLTSPQNPLLARVTVNRFWQMYFGTGIVKTAEDFGRQGEWPSHPELLDWLATELVRSGWDTKALQKVIVLSATYRQSSALTPELLQRDPDNRLLARGPRFRLSAEMVRDQALFVSGLLVEQVGGPSVKPYQPAGLWKDLTMQGLDYDQGSGDDLHRRSLYTFWKRTIAPPMMATFDSALRESCTVREMRSNTPLQALDLMNDVTFLEAAQTLGSGMLREGGSTADSRLSWGFRLLTARTPTARELDVLRNDLAAHRDYFLTNREKAGQYLRAGMLPDTKDSGKQELAAYTSLASLLLNLDEAITKE